MINTYNKFDKIIGFPCSFVHPGHLEFGNRNLRTKKYEKLFILKLGILQKKNIQQ